MRFLATLALLSVATAASFESEIKDISTGEDGIFPIEQGEVLGLVKLGEKIETIPSRFIVEIEPGADSDNLWNNLEIEGYNFTVGEYQPLQNSTYVRLDVDNYNRNPNTNLSVSNLLALTEGVLGVLNDERMSNGFAYVARLEPEWDPHVTTGVQWLHKLGIKGKGVTVGIIDTGIDLSHDAFAGKTIKGTNHVSDVVTEDIDDLYGHGTLIASIFGGQSSKMVGVAPEATIRMYRVANADGYGSVSAIKAAALKAQADGVDLISISFGSAMTSYLSDSLAKTLSEIAKKIPVVVAAGNDGEKGTFQSTKFGAYENVITVGSVESTSLVTWPMSIRASDGEDFLFNYVTKGSAFPYTGTFDAEFVKDLCDYPGGTPGDVVLFGYALTCQPEDLSDKYPKVKAFLSFTNVPFYQRGIWDYGVTTFDVETWLTKKAGSSFRVTMDAGASPFMSSRKDSWAGKMAEMSTWGPTYTNGFYPSILAPGGNMFGAANGGGYRVDSGTSIATPYVAGVIALYLSQNPGASVAQVRNKLLSTASLLPLYKDGKVNPGKIEPVIHQGAGMVDAWKFLFSEIELTSDPLLDWGDRNQQPGVGFLKWKNTGKKTKTYRVTHGKGLAINSRSDGGAPARYYPEMVPQYAKALLAQANDVITLKPGQEALYRFRLLGPELEDTKKFTTWQGYLRIRDDTNLSITVPYMGVQSFTYAWNPIHAEPEYSPLPKTTSFEQDKWPTANYLLDYGTERYSFDLVEEYYNVDSNQALWENIPGFVGSLKGHLKGASYNFEIGFPLSLTQFGKFSVDFAGLVSGRTVAPGKYKILMRARRFFAYNASRRSAWQYFLSDTIEIKAKQSVSSSESESSSVTSDVYISTSSSDIGGWPSSSEKWSNSSSTYSDEYMTPVSPSPVTPTPETPSPLTPTVSSPEVPGGKSPTIDEVTVTKSCTTGCGKSDNKPNDKVTVTKSCTTGCNEPKDKPNDKITVTTITKCSYGGCEQVPVTIGVTKTVKVTVTSCSNNVCATKVTLVAEHVGTTSVGGKVEFYTSVSTIENTHSVSTFYNAASRTMGLVILLLLSFLAI